MEPIAVLKSFTHTATTTATRVDPELPNVSSMLLKNSDASAVLYVGGSDVTTANGYPVAAGAELAVDARAVVYVVVASGSVTVNVLAGG